jgi:hypothetical protein
MTISKFEDLQINPLIKGADHYSRVSYPLRYGCYSEIKSKEYTWQFNLNGEIKFVTGKTDNWPDPSEWLKRTVTNDWLYYSTGGYSGTMEYSGEYYVPCARYSTNSIILNNPFDMAGVKSAIESVDELKDMVKHLDPERFDDEARRFIDKYVRCSKEDPDSAH